MKNLLFLVFVLFAISSCKVSDSVTASQSDAPGNLVYDQISRSDKLSNKMTFKVIEQSNIDKDVAQLNRIFKNQLIENGFNQVDENPELLIQSVVASVNFKQEVMGHFWSSSVRGEEVGNSLPETKYGQYGKILFMIQDAVTYEVLWMGTGTGVLTTANETLNSMEIKNGLNQMIADLK